MRFRWQKERNPAFTQGAPTLSGRRERSIVARTSAYALIRQNRMSSQLSCGMGDDTPLSGPHAPMFRSRSGRVRRAPIETNAHAYGIGTPLSRS